MAFAGLMSPCTSDAPWTASSARAQVEADPEQGLAGQRTVAVKQGIEGLSGHEVGPDAGPAVVRLGAMHHEHVGVADPGEAARLLEVVLAAGRATGGIDAPELERHVAPKRGVAGAVDEAEAARTDPFEHRERAPLERRFRSRRLCYRLPGLQDGDQRFKGRGQEGRSAGHGERGVLELQAGLGLEQVHDLRAQDLVAPAQLDDQRSARGGRDLEGGVEDPANALPALWVEVPGALHRSPPCSSR